MDWHTLNYGQGVMPDLGDAFQKTSPFAICGANVFMLLGAFLGSLYGENGYSWAALRGQGDEYGAENAPEARHSPKKRAMASHSKCRLGFRRNRRFTKVVAFMKSASVRSRSAPRFPL